jgi:ABC-type uncharacterized transport system permease subunit
LINLIVLIYKRLTIYLMATPFLIFTLLSLPSYVLLKRFFSNAVSLSLVAGAFSALYALIFANTDFLYDLHVLATILSVTILIITIFEALLLERHSINLKKGLSESSLRTPIESQFKFLLKVLGVGLIVLVFALVTGFLIYSDPDIESRIKILLSCLALAIYISVYIAMKYSKLSAKYALRFLLITFLLIIITYFLNILIIDRYT